MEWAPTHVAPWQVTKSTGRTGRIKSRQKERPEIKTDTIGFTGKKGKGDLSGTWKVKKNPLMKKKIYRGRTGHGK